MDLSLTKTQETLKSDAREFFERECPTSLVRAMELDERGYPADLWERMAALGWMGLPFAERYGGSGGSLTDLAVLLEEFGRALVPGPFFNSVGVVGLTIQDAGSDRQREDILPRIADGSLIATAAMLEEDARYRPDAIRMSVERRGDESVLNGVKMFVEYANSADLLLTPFRTSQNGSPEKGITLALIPTSADGIRATSLDSIARDRQYSLHFQDVSLPSDAIVGGENSGWPTLKAALDRAAMLHCAQSVGAARRVLEMTVDYTKQRVQFDRPIASFQSVQHSCADMVIAIDSARLAVYQAITRIEDGRDAEKEIALAKTLANHAYKWTTLTAQQVHGGIAFMEEYDLQLWTRRAKVAELKFGASSGYLETFARRMGLA